MTLLPLDLPAGFYRNGTEFDASNRWRDGSLVRWRDGSLRPIGGWQILKSGFSPKVSLAHYQTSTKRTCLLIRARYRREKIGK